MATNHPFVQQTRNRERHRPTAEQLFSRVQLVRSREVEVIEDQLWRNDIECISGGASITDAHTLAIHTEHETKTVTAENILLAVGTVATPQPGSGVDGEIEMVHLTHLPRRLAVVGGGVIGIEPEHR